MEKMEDDAGEEGDVTGTPRPSHERILTQTLIFAPR
jgi:hypothetical protein